MTPVQTVVSVMALNVLGTLTLQAGSTVAITGQSTLPPGTSTAIA